MGQETPPPSSSYSMLLSNNNVITSLMQQQNMNKTNALTKSLWPSNEQSILDKHQSSSSSTPPISNDLFTLFQPNRTMINDQQQLLGKNILPSSSSSSLTMATTLESLENYLVTTDVHNNYHNGLNRLTTTAATSQAIPIKNNHDDMSHCLKSFLLNNEQQRNTTTTTTESIDGSNNKNGVIDNISSSLSSSESESSQYTPPSALVSDIIQETVTFEHTEDFIRSLQIPLDVLDDLASRFVLNMPQEEKYDPIRICFQMENAFWHYLDFCCECNSRLPKFRFKRFAQIMFTYVPRLRQFLDVFDDVVNQWIQYKFSIPCSGAIMLDETMDYILLVQGYGSRTWGFPKGKVNHDESLMNCAVREVFEETGYNCMGNIFEEQYLERKIFESRLRLYLIRNVELNYDFKPQARNEIRSIKWFALKDFPQNRQGQQQQQQQIMTVINGDNDGGDIVMMPQNASKFVSVMPFIQAIRKWVENEKRKLKFARKRERRQQMKLAKQQQRKASESVDNVAGTNSTTIPATNIGERDGGSNSSSPTSTIEDLNDNKTLVTVADDDSSDDPLPNQSTTAFVDVDLNTILGFREMYNYKNDQRNLLTREQRNHEQQQQQTWQQQISNGGSSGGGGDGRQQQQQKSLPQAGHLEDIERALMENAFNKNDNSASSSILFGSKGGSCTEKLNILFGLANQSSSSSSNKMISLNNQRPFSSMSVNLSNGNNNDNDMESAINKMIKPSLAPIGTKRSSSISGAGYFDNQRKNFSGQTVISTNNNNDNDNGSHCNNSSTNNMPKLQTNESSIETMLNDLIVNTTNHQNSKLSIQQQQQHQQSPNTATTTTTCRRTEKMKNGHYNGLESETVMSVHPKIEQLLQRLKTVYMA
ncbi:mRNA-decapping enzyme subunit 2 [Dermatophagoides farinae]|uniref:mRNA-decapping enzyme 2 n=2 Tax=Dermatophagoides farinae TaxID=6954 RepID=A0A922HZZ5_DERFA|nr:mRNA-decapping enzyme subunit 2 [Dermatophagoides farinae]